MLSKTKKIGLLIGLPLILIIALVLLSVFGVIPGIWSTGPKSVSHERPRILTTLSWQVPETLSEFLNDERASLDLLLSSEKLSAQLMAASQVSDVVDSRLAMSNLRALQVSAAEAAAESQKNGTGTLQADASWQTLAAGTPAKASADKAAAVKVAADKAAAVKAKLDQLLAPAAEELGLVDPQVDFKSIWTKPADVLLHWTPHGQWIPDDGYRLYRTVAGKTDLIAEGLATESSISQNIKGNSSAAEYLASLWSDASLTPQKMTEIGVASSSEFSQLVYRSRIANKARSRISGEKDFIWLRSWLLTVAGSVTEKIPEADSIQRTSLQISRMTRPKQFSFGENKMASQADMGLKSMVVVSGYAALADETGGAARLALVSQIMEARKSILAKAFTDQEFAADVGLGYHDAVKSLNLAAGTVVTYRLETADGGTWSTKVTTGTEQPLLAPQGLAGYGIDQVVSLRWQAPADPGQSSIISGYYIERKKPGEKQFQRINTVPVAISYTLDETGVFFESPSFFQDESLDNSEKAAYRIQALDIFGRTSPFSEPIDIQVYKVTPPAAPIVGQPVTSSGTASRTETILKKTASLNSGTKGLIVPVSQSSADTRTLVIYRATAVGAGLFGEPAEAGRFAINETTQDHVQPSTLPAERVVKTGRISSLVAPDNGSGVDLAFFDANVEPGCTYKYWAAALDEWGNESTWSASRVQGVPLVDAPAAPAKLEINLQVNDLPDLSAMAAGFGTPIARQKTIQARTDNVRIGVSVSDLPYTGETTQLPQIVSASFGNLPDPDRVQTVIALENADLVPDGSARVYWTPYAGEGLLGYLVYRADVDGKSLTDLQAMSRESLVQSFGWSLIQTLVKENQLIDKTLTRKDNRIYLYLVCLAADPSPAGGQSGSNSDLTNLSLFAPGGWIQLSWDKPDDAQVQAYRIYRAEVDAFSKDQDPDKLEWHLIADRLRYTTFTEKVDQTYAHYYYYKVTSLSIWSLESDASAIAQYRVPATSPPQTPSMLLPLAQKGKIQVNWAGVPHASQYYVYRTAVPKIQEADLVALEKNQPDLYKGLFQTVSAADSFLFSKIRLVGTRALQPAADTPVLSVDKFNTLQQVAPSTLADSISQVSAAAKLTAFRTIADKYGPLALAPYGNLSEAAAKLVIWEKIAAVPVTAGQDPLSAYQFVDDDVIFGTTYLYTVQAENDDHLLSGRPVPVSAMPRKAGPFDPVTGLKGAISENKPRLAWDQAKDTNLSWVESREYVAGYIVYRSTAENGPYYQASPLLSELSWRDDAADVSAWNWYKVKVVDTAGYLSDYSIAVLVRQTPAFVINNAVLPVLPSSGGTLSPAALAVAPMALPIVTTRPTITTYKHYDMVSAGTFQIKDVNVIQSTLPTSGTGLLSLGREELIQVSLNSVLIADTPLLGANTGRILRGSVTLVKATYLPKAGVTFSKLTISSNGAGICDGYLQSPVDQGSMVNKNLMGDLFAIQFMDSPFTSDGTITVSAVPGFRCGQLVFAPSQNARIHLVQNARLTSLVELNNGKAMKHFSLETLDNLGLNYIYTQVNFDRSGSLEGSLQLEAPQVVRLVVPAGLGIQAATSVLTYQDGQIDSSASSLQGKIILPFQTFDDHYVPPLSVIRQPIVSQPGNLLGFDRFLPGGIVDMTGDNSTDAILKAMSATELAELDESMAYLASRVQSCSLLVLPLDPVQREKMSSVPIKLNTWSGDGFVLDPITMTPANIGNNAEDTSDAVGVTPGPVALDLDRTAHVNTQAPAETQDDGWVGIIVKEGWLFLPAAYLKTADNKRAQFDLASGELLYDLNGIAYQNLTYNANGTPANFGDALGGFRDVTIFDCMIDLYGNKVNIEINGELGIPLFGYQKAKVKLYTSKETGKLVCTVAETDKFDPAGTGEVMVKILGGYLAKDGLHVNGTLDVHYPGKLQFSDQMFNELIIPADMKFMTEISNPDSLYGTALFDQPLLVDFHDDFATELRSFSFVSAEKTAYLSQLKPLYADGLTRSLRFSGKSVTGNMAVSFYETSLTLWGGLQLSDNLTLNTNEDFDHLVIDQVFNKPALDYQKSQARMKFTFEEFLSVDGVVTPEPTSGDAGIVEFDMDDYNLLFNNISDLAGYNVDANVRIGYDRKNSRYFFVIGTYYDDPEGGISFYYGKMNQITGVLGYNVDLPKGPDNRYAIPKGSGALYQAVDAMAVDQSEGGTYFFASTCNLYFEIGYDDISIPICDVRDTTIIVEKGPNIESSGDLYAPLDVEKLISGKGFIKAGYTIIGYYHPERLFQFSSVLYNVPMYTFEVNGEVSFEWNPVFWELRAGYPDALKAVGNSIFECGFGIDYRSSKVEDDSYLKGQIYFEYETGIIEISPVYVRAYLHVGGEGSYEFDQKLFRLYVNLYGGAEGGISAFGKHFAIISLMLDAAGELVSDGGDWTLDAQVSIYYSLDLWLDDIEGSVNWHITRNL